MRTHFRWFVGVALATTLGSCGLGDDPGDEEREEPRPAAEKAENLFITPEQKGALRDTAVAHCADEGHGDCEGISGPLPGTYFGRQGDTFWAVASFRHPTRGVEGQPLLLTREAGGRWSVADATGGTSCLVPSALAKKWDFASASDRKDPTCFRTPKPRVPEQRSDDEAPAQENVEAFRELATSTTARLEQYWSETLPQAFGVPYRSPRIAGAYTSEADAPACGGKPVPRNNAVYCRPDRFIAWDEPQFMLPAYQRFGDMAPAMVLAHEFGHAVQDLLGWTFPHNIHGELNADCLAGAWARSADSLQQQGMRARELDDAVGPLFDFRDPEGSEWFDENAHGTALQRIAAFQHGTAGEVSRQCTPTPEHPAGFPGAPTDLPEEAPAAAGAPVGAPPETAPEPSATVP
jgi:hypothetical protein